MSITTFINPYSYWVLKKQGHLLTDPRLNYEYDGISLALLSRMLGKGKKRKSFDDTSLAPQIFHDASIMGHSIALIGSAPGITEKAAQILKRRDPKLNITLTQNGFMSKSERKATLEQCLSIDVVICSMGTPYQEYFLLDLLELGWKGAGYTCGGYLDQLVASDGADYYPPFFNVLNLRWLYRIIREPRRLLYRYACIYPIGCFYFIMDRWPSRH